VIAAVVDGVRSVPEAELRAAVQPSRILPSVLWNPRLTAPDGTCLPTPDGYIPQARLALEVDSREFHAEGEHWVRTLHRQNQYQQYGIAVLVFTPAEIRADPARVRRMIERAYQQRVAGGSPEIAFTVQPA
jgi:hypothetical protein